MRYGGRAAATFNVIQSGVNAYKSLHVGAPLALKPLRSPMGNQEGRPRQLTVAKKPNRGRSGYWNEAEWELRPCAILESTSLFAIITRMKSLGKDTLSGAAPRVRYEIVATAEAGRRVDNFLVPHLRGLPRSRLYRSLRNGEVRVNGCRVRSSYRLRDGDRVRIPPLRVAAPATRPSAPPRLDTLYEDNDLLVLNKPAGWAVHGGSGLRCGLIESLKAQLSGKSFLELAHRLDRETSGCLLLAKNAPFLRQLHDLLRAGDVEKRYWAVLLGAPLRSSPLRVELPLEKRRDGPGRARTRVTAQGKAACSEFQLLETLPAGGQWVEVRAYTGKTHQVRAHAAAIGRPLAGDELYGERKWNRALRAIGLRRLFLHACRVAFRVPETGRSYCFKAPLGADLESVLQSLRTADGTAWGGYAQEQNTPLEKDPRYSL